MTGSARPPGRRRSPRPPGPRSPWRPPTPLGYPRSIESAGGLAAPLLAGAAFTMTSIFLQGIGPGPGFTRWPNVALTLFVLAGLAQIVAVQCAVWARRYDVAPDELAAWYPDELPRGRPTVWLRNVQGAHAERASRWAGRTRAAYHLGIVSLLAGVAIALVPPGGIPAARWVTIGLASAGAPAELAWIATTLWRERR